MTLAFIAFALGFGVLIGALTQVLLRLKRPEWTPEQRRFKAALPAPVVVLAICILGAIGVVANGWQEFDDLALATLLGTAIVCGGVSLVGGLVAAHLMERRAAR